jgi:hypothetical protein
MANSGPILNSSARSMPFVRVRTGRRFHPRRVVCREKSILGERDTVMTGSPSRPEARGSAPRAIVKLHFCCGGAAGPAGRSSFAMHLVMNVLRAWPVSF